MAITPIKITNRLGTTVTTPSATTNAGPTTGDIGASGTTPTPAALCRIFDVELTSGGAGEFLQINIPSSIQTYAPGTGGAGIGLAITILPLNAAAGAATWWVDQGSTLITIVFLSACADGLFRIVIDGRHSIGR
jgi:hypothetical protein